MRNVPKWSGTSRSAQRIMALPNRIRSTMSLSRLLSFDTTNSGSNSVRIDWKPSNFIVVERSLRKNLVSKFYHQLSYFLKLSGLLNMISELHIKGFLIISEFYLFFADWTKSIKFYHSLSQYITSLKRRKGSFAEFLRRKSNMHQKLAYDGIRAGWNFECERVSYPKFRPSWYAFLTPAFLLQE